MLLWLAQANGMREARPLTVAITDELSSAPVSGLDIEIFDATGLSVATLQSDAEGRAVWTPDAPVSSPLRVRVTDPKAIYVDAVELAEDDECSISVRTGVTVELLVAARSGSVDECALEVWTAGSKRGRRWQGERIVVGDAILHRAEIAPVAPGPAKIFVIAKGFETRVVDVTIPESGGNLGRVEIEPGGAVLRGQVDPSIALAPTHAFLRFDGAGLTVPVENGAFTFEGLPRTRGVLVLLAGERELFSREVLVDRPVVELGAVRPRS
ncbi:MAG TPA: hypothetical protein VK116_02035 [Planctomycetota bacterium]|nr:hypothetical protein [Planctomycetota bacterium]